MTSNRPPTRSVTGLLLSMVLVALSTVSLGAPLRAQQPTEDGERVAPEFRAGQWGAQFIASSSFTGAGVLRFRSPQTAWTLDGAVAISTSNGKSGSVTSQVGDYSASSVTTRLGLRRYGAPRGPIRSFYGGGVHGSVGHASSEVLQLIGIPPVKHTTSSYKAGAFGELGASYFVTSHLALGARGVGTAGYERSKVDANGSREGPKYSSDGMFLQFGSVQLQVTLFF